jgi:hypothetical protein
MFVYAFACLLAIRVGCSPGKTQIRKQVARHLPSRAKPNFTATLVAITKMLGLFVGGRYRSRINNPKHAIP